MAFLIRLIHVSAVASIFGGALLLFIMLGRRSKHIEPLFDLMRVYEWTFWGSIGLTVMTGLGNLGHFGEYLPGPSTSWGRKLTIKLLLVLIFISFSALRTMVLGLTLVESRRRETPAAVLRNLHGLYGATAVLVVAVLGVAVSLAHF